MNICLKQIKMYPVHLCFKRIQNTQSIFKKSKPEGRNTMKEKVYITKKEREKCRKVTAAYTELEDAEIVVVDAGKYGFVKLQGYDPAYGFDSNMVFTDHKQLFDELWENWLCIQLIKLSKGTPLEKIDCLDRFKFLPEEEQKKLTEKRYWFAEQAEINIE